MILTAVLTILVSQDQGLAPALWGEEVEGYQLAVATARGTFRLGEPIEISTYIRNNGLAVELFTKKAKRIAEYKLLLQQNRLRMKKSPSAENVQLMRGADGKPLLKDGRQVTLDLSRGVSSSPFASGQVRLLEQVDLAKDFEITEPGVYILQTTWEVPSRDNPEKKTLIVANEVTIRVVRI